MSGLPDWKTMDRTTFVERLTDLCNSGLSAGRISFQFANCPSASAVVGAVYRLRQKGVNIALGGDFGGPQARAAVALKSKNPARPKRAKPQAPKKPPKRKPSPRTEEATSWRGANNPHRSDVKGRAEQRAASPGLPAHLVAGEARKPIEAVGVPTSRNLKLVELTERTCKWPHGDPLAEDFGFCGNDSTETGPYCRYHARLAFTPAVHRLSVPKGA